MTAIALTIAGSDSSGGAGTEADLKTFAALGVYGACVTTALTAQNTLGVKAVHEVPADFITAQIDAVFADLDVRAVKIGMLGNEAAAVAVARALDRFRPPHVVLDPVLAATSGERLLHAGALGALRELIRRVDVLTPNLIEAATLLEAPVAADEEQMRLQGETLLALGAGAVLMKGGHHHGPESVDILVAPSGTLRLASPRIAARNTHGTGCTLSAAIAAGLAKGDGLGDAVRAAKDYVTAAIAAADQLKVGKGRGPLNHFYRWW